MRLARFRAVRPTTGDPVSSAPAVDPSENPTNLASIRRWLWWCIVAVFAAVVVGGITRLTESGLSITEWKPVGGVLPPMSAAAWEVAYRAFLEIPQAQSTHLGITLAGFKAIYWWEWFHRILARGVGLVFAIPFLYLLVRGRMPRRFILPLAALPMLTLAQGVLGWYMVASGLVERDNVSAYRLAAHLALAMAILAVAVWIRDGLGQSATRERASRAWRRGLAALTALVTTTVITGAFVAGLRAGKIFNTFPLMGGDLVPVGYGQLSPWWTNAFENPAAAQFNHRLLAIFTGLVVIGVAWFASRAEHAVLPAAARRATLVLSGVVLLQVAIGITTLLFAVPITLGVLHQFVGVFAFMAALTALRRA